MSKPHDDSRTRPEILIEDQVREPQRYKVLIHNDDYTSMDFVVEVLVRVFKKSEAEATIIMLAVHNEGLGVCGVYTHEVAETKIETVHRMAKQAGFPLKCSMERE